MINDTEVRRASWASARVAAASLLMLAAAFSASAQDVPTPAEQPPENQGAPRPTEGIEGGHRFQPTPGALGKPDVSSQSAKTVDELYKKLIQQEKDFERQRQLAPATPGAPQSPPGNGD